MGLMLGNRRRAKSPENREPGRTQRLTPGLESRTLRPPRPFPERSAGALVVRRLAASLMLLACFLGIVQPALACVSRPDCCSSGCSTQAQPGLADAALDDCCAIQAAVGASVSLAPQPRHALGVVGGSPTPVAPVVDLQLRPQRDIPARPSATRYPTDQSLTYLRTARLRL